MITLLYARYSSDLQNPRSVEDQLVDCRARCLTEGWTVAGEYHDNATSGAAGLSEQQRPGLAALLARLEQGGVQQVLTESTDRLARHQGDDFAVREAIEFAGARLFTLMQGHVDQVSGTLHGLMSAKFRQDLAHRVRRGHRGNISQGRAASGIAYGYCKVIRHDDKGEPIRGLREINPDTSKVVVRIFEAYRDGQSTIQIARALNLDGIPAPRGGVWRASTIAGHWKEGFGVLSNPIYIGRLEYGRSRSVVDPRTRRRSTKKGVGEVATADAPHLRIIDDALWHAVQSQLEARGADAFGGRHPERQRRPKRLLSGLGVCGSCGANWIVTRGDNFGCSGVVGGSSCPNRRLISTRQYEERVLAQLQAELLAPEVVAAYLDEYRAEHARLAREASSERRTLERRRDDAARKVARLVDFIAEGEAIPELRAKLVQAKAEQAAAEKALASIEALPVIALHPTLARQYEAAVANLAQELADPAMREAAAPKLRALISRIEVHPRGEQRRAGVDIKVIRHLDEALALTLRRTG